MVKEIGRINSHHKNSELLVEVVQSNHRSIPPRIKSNRERGTVREPHALPLLTALFCRVVKENPTRLVCNLRDPWSQHPGSCYPWTFYER